MNHKQTREAIDTTLVDNIFVFAGEGASWGSVPSKERGMVFENNIVVGLKDPEYIKLTANPVFVAPGTDPSEIDMTDPTRLSGFKLCKNSPAIGTGKKSDNAALIDFWGDKINSVNIGAFGRDGVDCATR